MWPILRYFSRERLSLFLFLTLTLTLYLNLILTLTLILVVSGGSGMNPKNRGFIRACRPRVRKKLKNSEKRFAKTGSKTGANQQKPKGRTTAFSPKTRELRRKPDGKPKQEWK